MMFFKISLLMEKLNFYLLFQGEDDEEEGGDGGSGGGGGGGGGSPEGLYSSILQSYCH